MKQFRRRDFLQMAGAGTAMTALPYLSCAGKKQTQAKQPNILIIYSDDQGYNDVSCFGSEIPTPNLDRIAAGGIRFTDFYANAPGCTPSRYSLLTGCYPTQSKHGLHGIIMPGDTYCLDPAETTLAERLKTAGYYTGIIGKWHLGHAKPENLPMHHGFDHFTGHSGGCIDFFTHSYGAKHDWWVNNKQTRETGFATDLLTDHAIRYLDNQKTSSAPFFLYLSYNAPHYGKTDRNNIPEGTLSISKFDYKGIKALNTLQAPKAYLDKFSHIQDGARKYYAAMVSNLDDNVGRVLDRLRQNGQLENTLVWFISDNGGDPKYGGRNNPLRGHKRDLFEGGVRVPAMLMWPSKIAPAQVVSQPLCNADLVPTLGAICGFNVNGDAVDGIDAGKTILKNEKVKRDLFWHFRGNGAYRQGKWKYVFQDKKHMLFDLENDLSEQQSLSEKYPDKLEELKKAYLKVLSKHKG
jgi:arylsulfatase A-like enzyme